MDKTSTRDTLSSQGSKAIYNEGLRSYMNSTYNRMTIGITITGIIAWMLSGYQPFLTFLDNNFWIMLVVFLAPLGFVIAMSAKIHSYSVQKLNMLFYLLAGFFGVGFTLTFAVVPPEGILRTLFATIAIFGSLSLWGYTTKKDLSGWGTFLFAGVIGLIVVMLLNMFVGGGEFSGIISTFGVLLFAGLIAYDTQKIKSQYFTHAGNPEMQDKMAIMGALSLYLDFINMFSFMLHFTGGSSD